MKVSNLATTISRRFLETPPLKILELSFRHNSKAKIHKQRKLKAYT